MFNVLLMPFNCPKTAKTVDISQWSEVSGQKNNFLGKIRFESYIIRILSRKQNKTKQPTCPGKGPRVVRKRPLDETFVLGQLG